MSILFVMIPLALVLLGVAVAAFFWAVRSGQFDDLEMHGTMVLFDEEDLGPAAGRPLAATSPPGEQFEQVEQVEPPDAASGGQR